jgi:hypothetical protein
MSFWNLNSLDIKIEEIEEIIQYFIKIFNHSHMCDYKIYENVIDDSCLNNIFCFCIFSMEDNNKSIEFYNDETEEKKIHELNGINIVYTKMKIINIKSSRNWKIVKVYKTDYLSEISEKYVNFNVFNYLKENKMRLCQNKKNNDKYVIDNLNKLSCEWITRSCESMFLKWTIDSNISFFDITMNNSVECFLNFVSLKKPLINNYKLREHRIVYYNGIYQSCLFLNKKCDKMIIILDTSKNNTLITNASKIKIKEGQILFFDKTVIFQNYNYLKLVVINLFDNDICDGNETYLV